MKNHIYIYTYMPNLKRKEKYEGGTKLKPDIYEQFPFQVPLRSRNM